VAKLTMTEKMNMLFILNGVVILEFLVVDKLQFIITTISKGLNIS